MAAVTANMEKAIPPPLELLSARMGKSHEIIIAIVQCVKLPRAIPLALTALGKISAINTQITFPCEKAKNEKKPNQKTKNQNPKTPHRTPLIPF